LALWPPGAVVAFLQQLTSKCVERELLHLASMAAPTAEIAVAGAVEASARRHDEKGRRVGVAQRYLATTMSLGRRCGS
jgi:hypothetical protein